jgi:stage V sporulation protein G
MDCFRIPEWELMEEYRMEITDVRVRKIAKEGKMKAIVSITFDDEFVVHDIKVIEGEKGLFIAMPSKKASDGEYRDIAHPINSNTRDRIQSTILESYEKALLEPETEGADRNAV